MSFNAKLQRNEERKGRQRENCNRKGSKSISMSKITRVHNQDTNRRSTFGVFNSADSSPVF